MKDIQQLIKKDKDLSKYSNIYPKTYTDAVIDKESGKSLHDILLSFNMYFLNYTANSEITRLKVPKAIRKRGLWITYIKYDNIILTEYYIGNNIDDANWKNSSNWRCGNNSLVGDITISSNGYWVINNIETLHKAVGEKGNTPLLRVNDNRLEVSYDLGITWTVISDYIAASIVQQTGTNTNQVMSLKAVTDLITQLSNRITALENSAS